MCVDREQYPLVVLFARAGGSVVWERVRGALDAALACPSILSLFTSALAALRSIASNAVEVRTCIHYGD